MALVLTAAQMRASDRHAIDVLGVPGLALMENAGRGVADVVRAEVPPGGRVAVVCGAGQNGGDGFVVARWLALAGAAVEVIHALPPDKVAGDAAVWLKVLRALGTVPLRDASMIADEGAWAGALAGTDVIVDAVFGTGLRNDVSGVPAAAIAAMNAARARRIAVDVPSGLDADTGAIRSVCVRADVTVTMAARKVGLVLDPAAPIGRLEVVDIGAPVTVAAGSPLVHWLDEELVRPLVPRFEPAAHKGSRGHLLVVAGSAGKTGAALLTGRAAMRAGVGLCTVATTAAGQSALDAKVVELMTAVLCGGDDFDAGAWARLEALLPRMKALAVGPGMPEGPGARAFVRRLAAEVALPVVLDADGLNHLGRDAGAILRGAPGPRVLTPHPGEAARLVGRSTAAVQRDRLEVARTLARDTGAVVVLKGARTLVAEPDGTVAVNPTATAALGTAGAGDVLTGVIGGLLAQGLGASAAARLGVFVHGRSAGLAEERLGSDRLVAGDLPDAVARALMAL